MTKRGVYGHICVSCGHRGAGHVWNEETPWEAAVFVCSECGCKIDRDSPQEELGVTEWCERFGHQDATPSGECRRCRNLVPVSSSQVEDIG